MRNAAISRLPLHTASSNGVAPSWSCALTFAPRATCSLTASRSPDCTACRRSTAGLGWATSPMAASTRARDLQHVLHLFFQVEAEAIAHAGFEIADQRAEVGCGAVSCVVDEIGVIRGNVNVAALDALGPYLFEEPGGGHLAFSHGRRGNLRSDGGWQVLQQQVLENATGALHRHREFLVANLDDVARNFAQLAGIGCVQQQLRREDDPFLVPLENALAIVELALFI